MDLKQITLENFRNYSLSHTSFINGINVITGDNAQGKTNLLEAIVFLSGGASFRAAKKRELISFDADQAKIRAAVAKNNRDFDIFVAISEKAPLFIQVNGIKYRKNRDLSEFLKTVLFNPDDLDLIRAGAAARRRFLDMALCQLRPAYADALSRYHKFLESKQRILRHGHEKPSLYETLADFSAGMARTGALVIRRRAELVALIDREAAALHADISGGKEKLSLVYKTMSSVENPLLPAHETEQQMLAHFEARQKQEIEARQCLIGPHRDDIDVMLNERPARAFASQGQARTAALSMKLAERQVFFADTGEMPLLLLDDVLSELDMARQDFVLNRIEDGQVFITCCEEEKLAGVKNGQVIRVKGGAFI